MDHQINGVPADNWIPGDWGRFDNKNFDDATWETGFEGHNFIYIGRGITTLYREDKSLPAVEHEMRDDWTSIDGSVHGDPKLEDWRRVPSPKVFEGE